ncbi:MAG TPA: hypothetical protein VM450_01010 [Thermomicrobiales bacterium]|jgi:hypothetical protein|nr:hypothetical protein [Thermomicrobiales bacterium]
MSDDTNGTSSISDERLEILRLVENQTITAEEAARLLEALDRTDRQEQQRQTQPFSVGFPPGFPDVTFPQGFPFTAGPGVVPPNRRGRNVRIRITDVDTEEARLNLVLPQGLIDAGLKMAKRLAPEHIPDAKDLRESIDEGYEGTILDILDEDQRVEILIEPR